MRSVIYTHKFLKFFKIVFCCYLFKIGLLQVKSLTIKRAADAAGLSKILVRRGRWYKLHSSTDFNPSRRQYFCWLFCSKPFRIICFYPFDMSSLYQLVYISNMNQTLLKLNFGYILAKKSIFKVLIWIEMIVRWVSYPAANESAICAYWNYIS